MERSCCCGKISITRGAMALAVVSIIVSEVYLLASMYHVRTIDNKLVYGVLSILALVVYISVFVAIKKRICNLMIPVIALTAFLAIFAFLKFIVAIFTWSCSTVIPSFGVTLASCAEKNRRESDLFFFFALFCIHVMIAALWMLSVYWDCYNHLKERELRRLHYSAMERSCCFGKISVTRGALALAVVSIIVSESTLLSSMFHVSTIDNRLVL
ncbi:hypothetical protein PFISCL1PPCAC_17121, partial [Pristionchus fissidentatus]